MPLIALAIRVLVACVFAAAGLSKLFDQQGARKSVVDFGAPQWAAPAAAIVLPVAEIATAIMLIPTSTVMLGCMLAVILLLLFVAGVSVALVRGRSPECHCFGQLYSEPVSWKTLIQEAALVFCAGAVLWIDRSYPPTSAVAWISDSPSAAGIAIGLGAALLAAVEGWGLLHLFQQNGRLLLRMDDLERRLGGQQSRSQVGQGLPIGFKAPDFKLPSLIGGNDISLEELRKAKRAMMLVFSDPNCGPCSAMLPDLIRWEQDYADLFTLVLVTRGSASQNKSKLGASTIREVGLQKGREVAEAYKVAGTPSAVFVDDVGKIASPVAAGAQAIAELVAKMVVENSLTGVREGLNGGGNGMQIPRRVSIGLPIGGHSPKVVLPDLHGQVVDLEERLQRETVLVFWNPTCGFCARMLPDLKEWEKSQFEKNDQPEMVLISTGDAKINEAMELRSTILLDQSFGTAKSFRVAGTPSAVLISKEGKITSDVAVGATAVFALLGRSRPLEGEVRTLPAQAAEAN